MVLSHCQIVHSNSDTQQGVPIPAHDIKFSESTARLRPQLCIMNCIMTSFTKLASPQMRKGTLGLSDLVTLTVKLHGHKDSQSGNVAGARSLTLQVTAEELFTYVQPGISS